MLQSWRLGRFAGIDVNVHWSFILAPAAVLLSNRSNHPALAVVTVLAVFFCVVLHEFGHALMARRFGIGTHDITLYPMGGVARLERMPEQPGREIAIAVAGPAVNVVIAGGLWLGLYLGGYGALMHLYLSGTFVAALLVSVLFANIGLVLFNMLPAFPMDGGRVLRAVLATGMNRPKATEIAATVGMLLACAFVLAGILFGWFGLAIVGLFVVFAGRQELAMVRWQEYQRRMDTVNNPVVTVESNPGGAAPSHGFSGYLWDPVRRVWTVWHNGRAMGASRAEDTTPW